MPVTVSTFQGPPTQAWTTMNDFDGSNNLIYTGLARSFQNRPVTLTVTSISKANPAVITVTANGLQTDNTVDISGGTGDWAGINGSQKIISTGANTFTIAVDTSAFAATFAGTITTSSPQTSAAVWSIQKYYYTGTNQTRSAWADGDANPDNIWDNRTTAKYL